jgi:hypothetical protein
VREPLLHRQIADVLRLELAPAGRISKAGVVWWSVDMAAYGGSAPGLRVARGCIAGVPDMQVLYRGASHFIELKAEDGVVSPAQQAVGTAIVLTNCVYGISRDAFEVLALLDQWGIPRARRVVPGRGA